MPTDSLYPTVEIPNVDLWTFLFERKDREFPDNKIIYLDPQTNRSYNYAQVKNTARAFGEGLKAQWDWRKGDVLAIFAPNCIDTPAITWGCHWAGGVLSPANPAYTADELAFQLRDAGAKALVTQLPFYETARKAAKSVGLPEEKIILMGEDRDAQRKVKHFESIRSTSAVSKYRRSKINASKDLAFLVYSSGTTGRPKGVMLTHRNIVSNILQLKAGEAGNLSWKGGPSGNGDSIIAFLPFFHIYGLTCLIHQSLYSGLTLVVMPKFDIEEFCRIIQKHKISFAYVVPPVVLLLSKHPIVSKYDLSSIRMMNSGAAPLTTDLVEAMYKRLKIPIKQGYGLSETSPVTHTQPWEDWRRSLGSVGTLLPNQTAKYMSESGQEVSPGEVGELWIKGPNVFKGYLNNAEGTANALTDDGFFRTGDVGYQDAQGNFYITDRAKELIKYKGFQVAPAELEGLLLAHPEIVDVAVLGVVDKERATEIPRAFVVLKEGVKGDENKAIEIVSWLEPKVAQHKRLRGGVRFVQEIPKSASGKILRRILKQRMIEEEKLAERRAKPKL